MSNRFMGPGSLDAAFDIIKEEFTKYLSTDEARKMINDLVSPLTHKHAGSDITSGTVDIERLPVISIAKGGTGASTAAKARENLGITPSNIGASSDDHTHDDRYYTEAEMDKKLLGKANTNHSHTLSSLGAASASHTHTAEDVGADPAGSANTVQSNLTSHIDNKSNPHAVTKAQVGLSNVPNVSTNNQTPTYNISDVLVTLVSGEKLSISMGKIQKAINEFISHKDNTSNPHKVTLEQIGASAADHIHATATSLINGFMSKEDKAKLDGIAPGATRTLASTVTPKANGVASLGSDSGFARGDHTHPLQTNVSGNADTTTKLKTARNIDGVSFDGSSSINHYGICSTAAATTDKIVSCAGFVLESGADIKVKFTVTNTASSPKLNVNSTGAKPIFYRGSAISAGVLAANRTYEFIYNGAQFEFVGDVDTYKSPATTTPKSDATTGAVGTSTKYAREDHVHPQLTPAQLGADVAGAAAAVQANLNSHTSNKSNPHAVTKAQVGLGYVPNVTTNDQTPTWSVASALATITSGEKLSVSMGKIEKAITDLISHIGNKSNPHGVTKSQVGLSNVPNVSTNNQKPTWTVASSLATITSGETLTTSMGKIQKAITDLISHIGNKSNPHAVTYSQVGAAAASHGTHVSYSSTNPVMDGTASVGSASTVARSDHRHPTDTSRAAASHTHDDRYYTESEMDTKLSGKAASSHTHDDRYYTESEVDSKLSGKAASNHTHTASDIGAAASNHTHNTSNLNGDWLNLSARSYLSFGGMGGGACCPAVGGLGGGGLTAYSDVVLMPYGWSTVDELKSCMYIGYQTSGNYRIAARTDNLYNLGVSGKRFKALYAATSSIITSDRNKKKDIEYFDKDFIKMFILGLKPVNYKLIDNDSGRTHYGLIAQDVEELMNSLGMESTDFAGFIKSPKIEYKDTDENGDMLLSPIAEVIDGEYDYALRYEEFISPLIRMVQILQEEIKDLQDELDVLKSNS